MDVASRYSTLNREDKIQDRSPVGFGLEFLDLHDHYLPYSL